MCTGGFRSRVGIEQALNEDDIDLVGIGRPAAADPEWTERLLKSTSEGTSKNHADRCVAYSVTGGRWLEKLVPLKIVGGGMTTLWHELQMSRIARGEETKVAWSFERLLLVETCQAVSVRAIVSVVVLVLAWIMYRLA